MISLRWFMKKPLARWKLLGGVRLWYHPQYDLEDLARATRSRPIDGLRARRVLGLMSRRVGLRRDDVRRPAPASFQDLLRVHSESWIQASTRAEVLANVFGVEPADIQPDQVLAAQRRAAGGTMAAARAAISGRARVAFNLGGGFHHAAPEQGAGFCVYNDVAVAIAALREEGFDAPIAVVDLDYHQGDGTLLAFADDPSVLTWSIHGSVWCRVQGVADVGYSLPPGTRDADYLRLLEERLPAALEEHRPGLIFYVAGNDVLAGDKLGGFEMSLAGVLRRDRFVTRLARELEAPLVVTLAGGYSDDSWRASAAYLYWLLTGIPHVPRDAQEGLQRDFARIAKSLEPAALQREEDDLNLTAEDVLGDIAGPRKQRRFLGFYSIQGIELALERYGLLDSIRALGFKDLRLEVDPGDRSRQIVRLRGRPLEGGPKLLLVEIVLRVREIAAPWAARDEPPLRLLSMEWLLLQNPNLGFSLERPKLPGQQHPGLGRARQVLALLVQACKRLGLDGIVNRPGHYHVAAVTSRDMRFLEPRCEGRFYAMRHVLAGWDLAEATVAVESGRIKTEDGDVVSWEPGDYVLPVSSRVEAWFEDSVYAAEREAERDRLLEMGLHVE